MDLSVNMKIHSTTKLLRILPSFVSTMSNKDIMTPSVSPLCNDGDEVPPRATFKKFNHKSTIIVLIGNPSENYKSNPILVDDFYLSAYAFQKKRKSTSVKSPNFDPTLNPELISCISELKGKFAETLISLDLVASCLESPSEESADQLKLLTDHRKCTYEDTDKTLKKLLSLLRGHSSTESDNENADSTNDNLGCHLDCQPCSISQESLRKGINEYKQTQEPAFETKKGVMLHEKNMEQLHTTREWRELTKNMHLENQLKQLKQKKNSLKKQLETLQIKKEEILIELGKINVDTTARESQKRNSERSQRVFRNSSPEARSVSPTGNDNPIPKDDMLGYISDSSLNGNLSLNGFINSHTTHESDDHPVNTSGAYTAAPSTSQQLLMGAALQGRNQRAEKEEMVKKAKIHGGSQDSTGEIPAIQNESEMREMSSGGERIDQTGNVKVASLMPMPSGEERNEKGSTQRIYEDLSFSVQQDDSNGREYISLSNVPPTSVATMLYNNYKLLLLSLGQRFLFSDVVKLKEWATQKFSIENAQNGTDVLFQLDMKGIINASNLNPLRDFFESIVRIDLVCIIDEFLLGDYSLLRQIPAWKKREANRTHNLQHGSTSCYTSVVNTACSSQSFPQGSSTAGRTSTCPAEVNRNRNPATSRKPENNNTPQRSISGQNHHPVLTSFSGYPNTDNWKLCSRSPNENQSTAHEQGNAIPVGTGSSAVVGDVPVTNERIPTAGISSTRTNPAVTNNAINTHVTFGSNGSKLSKFQRPDTGKSIVSHARFLNTSRSQDLQIGSNWLCSHYKRQCYVKFECCDKFWPCHRCHNNQSTCGKKKLKSRDTEMVKCVHCNKVQPFGQFCCDCAMVFANYFCGLCKHLTGNDDHPYHCDKCGICRIHGDRSFHCNVCGICLDVKLRGNHRCRENSAHDECCICLEDSFTGCQILPCSHKVHKECATKMIRSGITRCPICRESFAHKLERRPIRNSRERSGI
ncbi:RING finger and CHY zinc finger domain-containing 1-like [Paramuricea clavata]|uniref:RING finger and CHY zinc finger domain-containing 1-like n=1 Tax=Paramuricea clavata TaxID=317549 RepID=A0A6S7J656_PARCT|nr:RING finger and CHY zinc finger domain-containing 1-like [Paramuricea clavata]